MCCFSRPVKFVGKTRIFARATDDGLQRLVYAMDVEIEHELAMVLPIPVPTNGPDEAVTFVDLSSYPDFFDALERAFPPDYLTMPQAKGGPFRGGPSPARTLDVHEVGLFEASFVPKPSDFSRLDARFRLPEHVLAELEAYRDFGFCVFRLSPKKRGIFGLRSARQSVHPMAFVFPRRDPHEVFFPTLHVHEGSVPDRATFDHTLYLQDEGPLGEGLDWTSSTSALGEHLDADRAKGLVVKTLHAKRLGLSGVHPNDDVRLRLPLGLEPSRIRGSGTYHRYRLRFAYANTFAEGLDARRVAWRETSRSRMPELARALAERLPLLLDSRAAAWKLAAFDENLPVHFVNGREIWRGTSYLDGSPAVPGGPGRVSMRPFTDRVELQDITVAFRELPGREAFSRILREIEELLDRAVTEGH
jgi:hypothetical protein